MMLGISPSTVVQVIFLAREGAAAEAECHAFIAGMNDDEKAALTAIAWVGRGAFEHAGLPGKGNATAAAPSRFQSTT